MFKRLFDWQISPTRKCLRQAELDHLHKFLPKLGPKTANDVKSLLAVRYGCKIGVTKILETKPEMTNCILMVVVVKAGHFLSEQAMTRAPALVKAGNGFAWSERSPELDAIMCTPCIRLHNKNQESLVIHA